MDVTVEGEEEEDVEPWGGSDAGSDEVEPMWAPGDEEGGGGGGGGGGGATKPTPAKSPKTASASHVKRLIKKDPLAQGGNEGGDKSATALTTKDNGGKDGKDGNTVAETPYKTPPKSTGGRDSLAAAAAAAAAGEAASAPPPPVSIRGGVAVFRAKGGDWTSHVAMVKQAPRQGLSIPLFTPH